MKQVYQSEDGKIFSNVTECIAHENQNINILYYYLYTPANLKDTPVSYSVKITKLYENLCDALFTEFIRNTIGPEIMRSFSSYSLSNNFTITNAILSQAYKVKRITAKEYQNTSSQRELNFNSFTGSVELNKNSTSWMDKVFVAPSINASVLDDMMCADHKWNSLCSAPIKAFTTDDLKKINIDNYIPPITTDSFNSLKNKTTSMFKKTLSITDLLY